MMPLIYTILFIKYDDGSVDTNVHQIAYRTHQNAKDYLLQKGYVSIGDNHFEIEGGVVGYTAEIVSVEIQ